MITRITDALRRQAGVNDWIVQHMQSTSTQHYVIGATPESKRKVENEETTVVVMNDHPGAGNGEPRRGQAQITILPGEENLAARLEQAVFMAGLTDNPPYGLPGAAAYPDVQLNDPELRDHPDEIAQRTIEQLQDALAAEPGVRLSAAEVFVDHDRIAMQNSRGAQGEEEQTELMLDIVLLASDGQDEMESWVSFNRRRASDLDIPAIIRRQAQYARDALRARTPRTGTFPVVVSDNALAELLMTGGNSPLVLRSAARLKYQKVTPWEVGQSIFPAERQGDPFTLYSNSLLPFGLRSKRFDGDGLAGQRVPIIENGVLAHFWANQRYAECLNIPPTGAFANMEIQAGTSAFADLLQSPGPLYHIVTFSAMSPDPFTGDLVGEIRLGYEIHNGQVRPIRGGSISGNLFQMLAGAQISRETAFLGDYRGPQAMRFEQVTVAGG